jgi:hypothetical protein
MQQTVLALTGMDSKGDFEGGSDLEISDNMDVVHRLSVERSGIERDAALRAVRELPCPFVS